MERMGPRACPSYTKLDQWQIEIGGLSIHRPDKPSSLPHRGRSALLSFIGRTLEQQSAGTKWQQISCPLQLLGLARRRSRQPAPRGLLVRRLRAPGCAETEGQGKLRILCRTGDTLTATEWRNVEMPRPRTHAVKLARACLASCMAAFVLVHAPRVRQALLSSLCDQLHRGCTSTDGLHLATKRLPEHLPCQGS